MGTPLFKPRHQVIVLVACALLLAMNPGYAQETLYDSGWHEGKAYMRDGSTRTGFFAVRLHHTTSTDTDGNTSDTDLYEIALRLDGGIKNGQPYYKEERIREKNVARLLFSEGYELIRLGNALGRVLLRAGKYTLLEAHPGYNKPDDASDIAHELIVSDGLEVATLSKPRHYAAWLARQAGRNGLTWQTTGQLRAIDVFKAILGHTINTPWRADTLLLHNGNRVVGQILDLTPRDISYRPASQSTRTIDTETVSEIRFRQGGILCLPWHSELTRRADAR